MTFYNVLEKAKALGKRGANAWFGPQLDDYMHVKGHLEQSDIELLIYHLKEAYAPTIEMTEIQMKQMMSFKEVNAGFSTFMYKQGLGQVPAFSDFIATEREDELMQAWLHPETIKVVE
ncbi:hypothetical protein FOL01_1332 [Weissella jogaejeotgali]|uniref:Uncharacterized protein n=1 Tax=Weissella jogaejeotgali TaxID=1631871 RepID=A0A1L6RCC8_9LACO|nr:hypothetical protein [Weissella jogaejeotgali]APS42191.1 hypothetical protein FOL01_1332 [Weissella jogaejeotgali]